MRILKGVDTMSKVKKPCVGCVYFKACGNTNRTVPCEGRQTKSDLKNKNKKGDE